MSAVMQFVPFCMNLMDFAVDSTSFFFFVLNPCVETLRGYTMFIHDFQVIWFSIHVFFYFRSKNSVSRHLK